MLRSLLLFAVSFTPETIKGLRNGGQRTRLELRVFNYGGFCCGQSHSKAYCTRKSRNQCRISGKKQRNQWDAKDYTGTKKGRTWSICCTVGFISLGTRAAGTQCYVYKQAITANGTLNGKRIIKHQDSSAQLWLQSYTSISGKPVKFTQLIKKSTITAVLQNVHQFISMEALLTDERISTAERIMSYNLATKTPEPTRSVKVNLNMKAVPIEIRINFLGKFAV